MYGLLRIEKEAIVARGWKCESERFIFIQWVPDGVSPMLKGVVNAHRGAIREIFNPFHVDLAAETSADLAENLIFDKIEGTTSGH